MQGSAGSACRWLSTHWCCLCLTSLIAFVSCCCCCCCRVTGMVLGNTISGISVGLASVIEELSSGETELRSSSSHQQNYELASRNPFFGNEGGSARDQISDDCTQSAFSRVAGNSGVVFGQPLQASLCRIGGTCGCGLWLATLVRSSNLCCLLSPLPLLPPPHPHACGMLRLAVGLFTLPQSSNLCCPLPSLSPSSIPPPHATTTHTAVAAAAAATAAA